MISETVSARSARDLHGLVFNPLCEFFNLLQESEKNQKT